MPFGTALNPETGRVQSGSLRNNRPASPFNAATTHYLYARKKTRSGTEQNCLLSKLIYSHLRHCCTHVLFAPGQRSLLSTPSFPVGISLQFKLTNTYYSFKKKR